VWAASASLVTALLSGLVFGVLPASRASRLDPVIALARR
jgi:putative ABC transport system permease protein